MLRPLQRRREIGRRSFTFRPFRPPKKRPTLLVVGLDGADLLPIAPDSERCIHGRPAIPVRSEGCGRDTVIARPRHPVCLDVH